MQSQLPLLQPVTVASCSFTSLHYWEELGSGFSITLVMKWKTASSTVLCLLFSRPTKPSSLSLSSYIRSSRPLTTLVAFTGLAPDTIWTSNPCFPPLRAQWSQWFFTYLAVHPFHPHFLLLAARVLRDTTAVSLRFHSLSIFSWLFFNICQVSKVPEK